MSYLIVRREIRKLSMQNTVVHDIVLLTENNEIHTRLEMERGKENEVKRQVAVLHELEN